MRMLVLSSTVRALPRSWCFSLHQERGRANSVATLTANIVAFNSQQLLIGAVSFRDSQAVRRPPRPFHIARSDCGHLAKFAFPHPRNHFFHRDSRHPKHAPTQFPRHVFEFLMRPHRAGKYTGTTMNRQVAHRAALIAGLLFTTLCIGTAGFTL